MNYLKIKNNGELDIRLVALMGGTTKAGDIYKIGQFGTGLKYVLAYCFRNGIDFKIFSGSKEVKIHTEIEVIKEQEFKIICIEGNRTSITTRMGADWQPWMIVRELYSNALDEGGAEYGVTSEIGGSPGETCFYIEMNLDFMKVYNDWNKYFIVGRLPMYETTDFALHPTSGNLKIYKHGILIHETKHRSMFSYDIKNASINELREYKGTVSTDLSRLFFEIDDKKVIEYILENIVQVDEHSEAMYYEATLELEWWQGVGYRMKNAWKEVLGEAKIISKKTKEAILAKNVNLDLDHTVSLPEHLYKCLSASFDGISAIRMADKVNEFYEIHDEELALKLKSALATLESANYFIHPELKFLFGEFGQKDTLAKISLDKKEILISQKMKDKSMFDFCATLIEENEHFQTGNSDCTREFQQHFIDMYTKALLAKAEIVL